MKKSSLIAVLLAFATAANISAYYDSQGIWHDNIIEHAAEVITGGRSSDTPADAEARKKAAQTLEDARTKAKRKAEDIKREARREYYDKQEKIQRKKEERRSIKA